MTESEITEHLVAIRDQMLETSTGVHALAMEQRFLAAHPDALDDRAVAMARNWLHLRCLALAKPPKSDTAQLPGLGGVPDVVTTYDGEGGYVYKRIRHASRQDLVNNVEIMLTNFVGAQLSLREARDIEGLLGPVMDEHGFTTAGKAIEWMGKQAP